MTYWLYFCKSIVVIYLFNNSIFNVNIGILGMLFNFKNVFVFAHSLLKSAVPVLMVWISRTSKPHVLSAAKPITIHFIFWVRRFNLTVLWLWLSFAFLKYVLQTSYSDYTFIVFWRSRKPTCNLENEWLNAYFGISRITKLGSRVSI